MNVKQERDALIKSALETIERAEKRGGFTDVERADLKAKEKEITELNEHLEKAAEDQAIFSGLGGGSFVPDHSGKGGAGGGLPVGNGAPLAVGGLSLKNSVERLADRLVETRGGAKALVSGQATATVVAQNPANLPQVPNSVLQLIRVTGLTSPVYRYLVQTARDLQAEAVPVGAVKPTSTVGLVSREDRLRVVATISDGIDKFVLQDTAAVQSLVQSELVYGIYSEVERLVLNGSGEGEEFLGMLGHSGIQTQAFETDLLTTLRRSITKIESLGYTPNAIVLSPADWETAEMTVTSGSGEYVLGASPVDRAARRLWGVQVTTSTAVAPGTGVVADLSQASLFTDSRGVTAEWNGQAKESFERNEVILRTEGRFGFGLGQPQAVVKVDTAATP
ncbi:phage major capsid protein [Dietzia sp. B19]|uniref:phage major capsid protein n=1 Tax=Dietzia sp. B19 TaxID=1630632 RepID=UPI0015F79BD3|nr:phage major capsid protein [Dietzia sp. B19]MBB1057557.1 phage major capsid protein [Dietzia sp. B19]